jgi:hypothetical protein
MQRANSLLVVGVLPTARTAGAWRHAELIDLPSLFGKMKGVAWSLRAGNAHERK